MVSAIFGELTTIASSFVTFLSGLFESVVSVFWTEGVGENPGTLTFVGTLMLIATATGLVIWAMYFIRNLIRIHRKG